MVIIIAYYAHHAERTPNCRQQLKGEWHVPDEYLEQFSLNAFVISRDCLFIENANGQIVFAGPVKCSVDNSELNKNRKSSCKYIEVEGGPDFLSRVRVQESEPGMRLLTDDMELVAVL